MEIRYCEVDQVQIGARLRSLDTKKIAALAESMEAIGLQQPISVWSPNMETLDLVAGLHRLEAARKLGWEDIDCIFVNMDEIDRQLWEIDENLCRADLSPAEMAQHLKQRELLWEEHQKRQVSVQVASKPQGGRPKGFAKDTEDKTGTPKRTTNRAISRANNIPADILGKIQGTDLDTGTYLDKLKKLAHDEQREKVDRDLKEIELKEIERAKNEALERENWKPRSIIREFKRWRARLAARMEKLGLGDDDLILVVKWSKSLKHSSESEKDKWENQALDLHEKGEPLKSALRLTKKAHNLELAQIKEEQEEREAKRAKHCAEQEDREFKEREPFEFFAQYLLEIVPGFSLYETKDYDLVIRHLKNCKLTKLTTALEKKKTEWDAEDEQISA